MTKDERLDKLRNDFVNESLVDFDKAMEKLQKKLLEYVIDEVATRATFTAGKIDYSVQNHITANRLSAEMEQFIAQMKPAFAEIAKKMLDYVSVSNNYYSTMGTVTQAQINLQLATLQQRIGIDANGSILKGSWIDRISEIQPVRQRIADYVGESIAKNASYKDFKKGMSEIITGNADIDGVMKRYTRQYVHDTFFRVGRTVDNFFANDLGLVYFEYMGDLIDTSRSFCRTHAGKVYHIKDVATFPKDLPYFQPDYNFFVDLGGYNCRHWLRFISEKMAAAKGYNISKWKN